MMYNVTNVPLVLYHLADICAIQKHLSVIQFVNYLILGKKGWITPSFFCLEQAETRQIRESFYVVYHLADIIYLSLVIVRIKPVLRWLNNTT